MSFVNAELPGRPGVALKAAWKAMRGDTREAFLPHLIGETSAEFLEDWLRRNNTPVSASTIRTYRRSLKASEGSRRE